MDAENDPSGRAAFMTRSFDEFVRAATGKAPYDYQSQIAADGLPEVLRAPTGTGKTRAAVLPWLYRRKEHPDADVRRATPRWLVFVLPQRTLVEQTSGAISKWLESLAWDVPVHVLMGGEDGDAHDWKLRPDRERIFVGTQDMILSRLLMRGFAESRAAWPASFGLLHAGVQFVFDEVQLMGPGLRTSLQLQGFRESLGTALPCRSMWMSATLTPEDLSTVDLTRTLRVFDLDIEDIQSSNDDELRTRINATRVISRLELGDVDQRRYPAALAHEAIKAHRTGTRTLVVLNTVERAVDTYAELTRLKPAAKLVLLHSRFRPNDRKDHTDRALKEPGEHGTILVSTQVLEAGVDTTSDILITEAAPWSSLVQRAGRCNRDGNAEDARLLWTTPPAGRDSHLPYEATDLDATADVLTSLEGQAVTGTQLSDQIVKQSEPNHALLRRRDLIGLFDTAPDLSGNDIDVTPFIRDATDRTVFVVWRTYPDGVSGDAPLPQRAELCPAPIGDVRKLAEKGEVMMYDQRSGEWRKADRKDVRPTTPLALDAARGGYTGETGFSPGSKQPVETLDVETVDLPDAMDVDTTSRTLPKRKWQRLDEHLADTERAARAVVTAMNPELSSDTCESIALAARYHDIGKAHDTFINSLRVANEGALPDESVVWAKSPSKTRLRHEPKGFRHELVSALLLLDPMTGLLDDVTEADLVAYLALAHHGKVRVSVRARPGEEEDTVLGVRKDSCTAPTILPGEKRLESRTISHDALKLGQDSLTDRALRLRDRPDLGPFRLAFCEAVVRAADWQASADNDGDSPCPK